MILLKTIVLWKMDGDNFSYLLMFYQCGTVFQTVFLTACYNPETASRVTLASLSIGFQPKLIRCLWIKYQYIKIQKYIFLFFFLIFLYWCFIKSVESDKSVFDLYLSGFSNTDSTLSLQKNATQSHKLQNNQGKSMIAEDSFVPLL